MTYATAASFEDAIRDIRKRYGEGAIMRLGDRPARVDAISTGSPALDIALGVGGIPRGRVTEIYGPESSGKTTLCQHLIAEAQRRGEATAFIDVEHALDAAYAAHCGVDVDRLYISQPDTGEQALEIAEAMVHGGAAVVVVDSVAALAPRAEVEGEMGDAHCGLQARLISQAMRKLAGPLRQNNTALVFTTQLRQRLGVMFGNPESDVGGYALRHHASVRLEVRRVEAIKEEGEVIGSRVRATVKKSKVSPPYKAAEFDIMHDAGISKAGDLVDLGIALQLIEGRNGAYLYRGKALGRGREAAKRALRGDPALAGEIENRIRQVTGLPALAGGIEDGKERSPARPTMAEAEAGGLDLVDPDELQEELELEMAGMP
jgi:recombination protein RecA